MFPCHFLEGVGANHLLDKFEIYYIILYREGIGLFSSFLLMLIEEGWQMLVLSRHRDESIIIGDDVVVTIVDIRGDKVRLGIKAPQDMPVHRQEVYDAIKHANERAGQVSPADTQEIEPVLASRIY